MMQLSTNFLRTLAGVLELKWLLIGLAFFSYGFFIKGQIMIYSDNLELISNSWDITLLLMNDMYLIVFFIIPLLLFFSFESLKYELEFQVLIRFDSNKSWVYRSLKLFWQSTWPLLGIWIFMSLYFMIGLPFSWSWSEINYSNIHRILPSEQVNYFSIPLISFIAQLVILFMVFSLTHVLLASVYVGTRNKNLVMIVCIVFFTLSLFGFKLFSGLFSLLSPSFYFSLIQGIAVLGSPYWALSVLTIILIVSPFALKILDIKIEKRLLIKKRYMPLMIYIFLCIIGFITTAFQNAPLSKTVWDLIILTFEGVSNGSFSYTSFFFYSTVYFGFTYLISMLMYKEFNELGIYKIVRYRNIKMWFWNWFKKILMILGAFLPFILGVNIVIGLVLGKSLSFESSLENISLIDVTIHFFLNGFLQMLVYILLLVIILFVTNDPTKIMLLISSFMVLMLPAFNIYDFIPIGLNSIASLVDASVFKIIIVLVITISLLYLLLSIIFKKSIKI